MDSAVRHDGGTVPDIINAWGDYVNANWKEATSIPEASE